MKRVLSVLLLIAVFMPMLATLGHIFAEGDDASQGVVSDTEQNATDAVKDVLYFSCVYDAENKSVDVSGTMKHDAFAEYNDFTLEIFLIPPGKTEREVADDPSASPLAHTSMSIKFGFNFKANSLVDRYSRYAIFLKSPSGERILATEAQYAEVQSTFEPSKNKTAFKGISGSSVSKASYVDADTVIIPVYLDMLFTKNSDGHIYQIGREMLFFDHGYIDELDRKINSASISGSGIYLQLLLRNGSEFASASADGARYVLPDVYSDSVLTRIHSAVEFLATRYSLSDSVKTFGFVVGKGWDDYKTYNYCGETSFEKYVEKCGFYSILISNAARGVNSNIDIVIPFTGEGLSTPVEGEESRDAFEVKELLGAVVDYYNDSFSEGIMVSILVNSGEVPLNITNQSILDGVDLTSDDGSVKFVAGRQADFSKYVKDLDLNYSGTLSGYMFVWTPPSTLSGNALAAAYAYSYYKLLADDSVSAFCVHFDDDADNVSNFEDINYVMKRIDTTKGVLATNNIISYFNKVSWAEILGGPINESKEEKSLYSVSPSFDFPIGVRGSFPYIDVSVATVLDGWYKGSGCGNIKIEYSKNEQKALKAELNMSKGSLSELIYKYEYQENMVYTPYLEFDFEISGASGALYEVTTVIENDNARFESSCAVEANNLSELILDMSEYSSFGPVKNIKIFVRSLDENYEKCTLWIYGVTGHSLEYGTQELEELISQEREKINEANNATEKISLKNILIVVAILIITGVFCAAIIVIFKRDNRSDEENEQ